MLLTAGPERKPDADERRKEVGAERPGAVAGHEGEVGPGAELLDPRLPLGGFDRACRAMQPGVTGDGIGSADKRVVRGPDECTIDSARIGSTASDSAAAGTFRIAASRTRRPSSSAARSASSVSSRARATRAWSGSLCGAAVLA